MKITHAEFLHCLLAARMMDESLKQFRVEEEMLRQWKISEGGAEWLTPDLRGWANWGSKIFEGLVMREVGREEEKRVMLQ